MLRSHAARTRILPDDRRPPLPTGNGGVTGTLLVDGFLRGTWKIARQRRSATPIIEGSEPLAADDRAALAEEGTRLFTFRRRRPIPRHRVRPSAVIDRSAGGKVFGGSVPAVAVAGH